MTFFHTMLKLALTAAITSLPMMAWAQSEPSKLLSDTKRAQLQQVRNNQQREANFKQTEAELRARHAQLTKYISDLKSENEKLSEQFQNNEEALAEKEKQLHLATGSLGELFGVVRQSAKELEQEQRGSVASIGQKVHLDIVQDIVAARTLPSKSQLYGLWNAIQQQINASATTEQLDLAVTTADGETKHKNVVRLGAFALADENGYLDWSGGSQRATAYPRQPADKLTSLLDVKGSQPVLALDATRGSLFEQLALTPTLKDRINHGGIVGKIILGLMIIGILIGLVRGAVLLASKAKIAKQLKDPENPLNSNSLGRILNVYREDNSPNVEALELRLLEAVMDEQQYLERGLSMIKLLAALAPMLGLLGTVTGMIETFQTITQFGNSDPRVMAGGISMALITTVLGLIAAMPLLLLHNVLSSQADSIRNIIEKQSIGLVAKRAESSRLLDKVA